MSFVTGIGLTVGNKPSNSAVRFELATPAMIAGNQITRGGSVPYALTAGAFSGELAPGLYKMYLGTSYVATIVVPDDDATYTFNQLVSDDTYILPSTPAGGFQPNASTTTPGLVKTNTNPGEGEDPVVYLKSEIDSLLNTLSAGSASMIGGVPTFDFRHTTRAVFLFSDGPVELGRSGNNIIFNILG